LRRENSALSISDAAKSGIHIGAADSPRSSKRIELSGSQVPLVRSVPITLHGGAERKSGQHRERVMSETEPVQITIATVRPVAGRSIFAFIDVELVIAGVSLTIHGIQARHVAPHGTSIHLPTYRAEGNAPRAAVTLPPELFTTLGDLILEDLVARGIAKPRISETATILEQ